MFGSFGDICGSISDACESSADVCDSTMSSLNITIGGTTYTDIFTKAGKALDIATKDVGINLDDCV